MQEPAHWFLPSATISAEDKVLISVIDEVYPELKLAERVSATRQALRRVLPEVMEPAHLRPTVAAESALREISQLDTFLDARHSGVALSIIERHYLGLA